MRRVHLVAAVLASVTVAGAVELGSFRFSDHLRCLQQVEANGLVFCILGEPGAAQGIMPAVFRRLPDGSLDEVWRDCDRRLRPWKLVLVELDGDPLPEVALGVFKATRHDRRMARRLFIYDWSGSSLAPAWLGSSLALPLVDFAFARDQAGRRDELISLERDRRALVARRYRWNGFGFVASESLRWPGTSSSPSPPGTSSSSSSTRTTITA